MRHLILTSLIIALPGLAAAQDRTIVTEPVPDILSTIDAPIEYDENGVMKAQHFRAEDLTPDQLEALLAEADKIRQFNQSIQTQPQTQTAAPALPASTEAQTVRTYTVVRGDTLFGIARRHGTTVTQLQQANGLNGTALSVGQSLVLPDTRAQASIAPGTTARGAGPVTRRIVQPLPFEPVTRDVDDSTTQIYAVLPKDTLYAISRRTCVTVGDLVDMNGLTNADALVPGQRLSLPEGHCLAR